MPLAFFVLDFIGRGGDVWLRGECAISVDEAGVEMNRLINT